MRQLANLLILAAILVFIFLQLRGLRPTDLNRIAETMRRLRGDGYNETFFRMLGVRHLTFDRTFDILIAIGLVIAFLVAILLMSPK